MQKFIKTFILPIVLILVSIGYMPGILLTSMYNRISIIISGLILFCLFVNFHKITNKQKKLFVNIVLFTSVISFLVFFLYGKNVLPTNLILSMLCYEVGYVSGINKESELIFDLKIFTIFALILGVVSVNKNVGSFEITEEYAISLKNSSGAILGTGAIVSIYLFYKTNSKFKYIWLFSMVLLLACLLTFRSRSAVFGLIVCAAISLLKQGRELRTGAFLKNALVLAVPIVLISLFSNFDIWQFFYDSMTSNKEVDDLDNLSSGRLVMIERGLSIWLQDPVGGNLSVNSQLLAIDNFFFSELCHRGLFGAILWFPPYFYIWKYTLKKIRRTRLQECYPYLGLMLLLVISFFEAPFPFGPGTAVMAVYFMVGVKARLKDIQGAV